MLYYMSIIVGFSCIPVRFSSEINKFRICFTDNRNLGLVLQLFSMLEYFINCTRYKTMHIKFGPSQS